MSVKMESMKLHALILFCTGVILVKFGNPSPVDHVMLIFGGAGWMALTGYEFYSRESTSELGVEA